MDFTKFLMVDIIHHMLGLALNSGEIVSYKVSIKLTKYEL